MLVIRTPDIMILEHTGHKKSRALRGAGYHLRVRVEMIMVWVGAGSAR